ncbi:related to B2-aldehyde-forming enzyme [Sporisorium reilianum f. sp. reilianum]|uniref:Related to B2-aldehyde-forming enzyme n=1 Tax=Sporisorium reilianum f. sp. reilianum TaxID=72559 RepID=A0A2N8U6D5_9BASI|nr:related to B2-aldehyde-forming enzyme [Sporisorium reilianum f. sp. reilianum]
MPSSLATKLCVALALASGIVGTLADDAHHDSAYVRSLKHARRSKHAERDDEAGPSSLQRRGPTYNGRATYYAAGLGACGNYNSGSDFIVALNAAQYGNMGQRSSWCGRTIAITYNGNTQYATVQDACPSCPYGGLDMSEGLFKAFASTNVGVFYMSWTAADGSDGGQKTTTSSTPAWTPRPTPTSTRTRPPSSTWTPPPPTSTSARSSSSSSSASSSSSSSSAASSASASSSASSSASASASASASSASSTPDSQAANNLDSFALIYQGLNQMAVAAAS